MTKLDLFNTVQFMHNTQTEAQYILQCYLYMYECMLRCENEHLQCIDHEILHCTVMHIDCV